MPTPLQKKVRFFFLLSFLSNIVFPFRVVAKILNTEVLIPPIKPPPHLRHLTKVNLNFCNYSVFSYL